MTDPFCHSQHPLAIVADGQGRHQAQSAIEKNLQKRFQFGLCGAAKTHLEIRQKMGLFREGQQTEHSQQNVHNCNHEGENAPENGQQNGT